MLPQYIKEKGLNYEIEYSKAYGGDAVYYSDFIHIKNRFVRCAGDFNRGLFPKFNDFNEFDEIVCKVNDIHEKYSLDKPDNFYLYPPKLDESKWKDYLISKGFRLINDNIYMISKVEVPQLKSNLLFKAPDKKEYFKWYYQSIKDSDYFSETWYQEMLPAWEHFIQEFKPYWLMDNNEVVGWVYCQFKEELCNVHDVWIEEAKRKKGLGRLMFDFIRIEADKRNCQYINLNTTESRRAFYEKIGFEVYDEFSVIRAI
jgi:GNAT superfamily N-acetyltransferase